MNTEECDYSGLPSYSCAHCQGIKEEPMPIYGNGDPSEFEMVGHIFEAAYNGRCTIDSSHEIKRRDKVAKVQRADNPMLPVAGVACIRCIRQLAS